MTNINTDGLVTVSIGNIVSSGAGFGVVIGTGANCIISSRVLYAADLRPGDLIRCKLTDNPAEEYRARTPYMVAYVDPNATAALRIAVTGGQNVHQAAAAPQIPEQLSFPFEEQLKNRTPTLTDVLTDWDDDSATTPTPAPAPAPAPKRETAADVRIKANDLLTAGGMWSLSDIRDKLWPDTDFGSGDYRYKLLTNALRDLHASAEVAVVGRRHSAEGNLTGVYYTKTPGNVRFVWEE